MASSTSLALLAMVLVVLLPISAVGLDNIAPSIAEIFCDEVLCGHGTCKIDSSSPVGFICECDANWKRNDDGDNDLRFLPCVIPECTLTYGSCQSAPPPVPVKEVPHNISAFDPCYWAYCGQGTCTRNTTIIHAPVCQCEAGSSNLFNISVFPCYNECALGSDCSKLGIKVANVNSTNGSSSQATSYLPGKWMTILMVSVGVMLWK